MKNYVLFVLFWLMSFNIMAQKISGIVKDETGKPVDAATILLLSAKDSVVVKYTASKADGQFQFAGVAFSDYVVKASHVGFKNNFSERLNVAGDIVVADIILAKNSAALGAVVVTAIKPMVEIKADKTILNVEGTINAVGSDVLELLRKSPGVMVDKDDNLSLSGKNGVRVYIDGKPSPLAGTDLAEFLKSLQSSNVEAIEIITNPSAKYDAAGNAGIINIRLKKNKSFGTNGSVNAGWGIGNYPKYNAGLSLNNRSKKINLFGNYNYNENKGLNRMQFYRTVADTIFDQKNRMINQGTNHSYKAGLDYTINKKNSIGINLNGTLNDGSMRSNSNTPIFYQPTDSKVKTLVANNSSQSNRDNINGNANYRYADTSGRELNLDADYARYDIFSNQMQPNIYYDANGNITGTVIYNMLAPTNINLYSVKADYEQNFKKGKLGLGGKLAKVNTDNDFKRYNVFSNNKMLDTLRSNRFKYDENINAFYINYNRSFKGFMLQAGLRAEQTAITGLSTGYKIQGNNYAFYDSAFKRDYVDFFPSLAVTFNKNPKNQLGLSYSRRIDRPAYQDLNPFEFKMDEYSFMKGNTNLRPQYSNSFGITHSYKYKLNSKLNYTHVTDIFAQLIDTTERSKSFMSKQNLATQDIVSLNISYPFAHKKFMSFINLNSSYSAYKADFGKGRKVDASVFNYNIFMQNSLRFAKTWTAELSGFYSSPSIWQGTFESKAMGGVDMGLQKQVLKNKATIKASMSDVFGTMRWKGSSNFAGQTIQASGRWESQVFKLNFSYRFGNTQVKAARQRKNAMEEENKRTQGGGGIGAGQ